MNNNGSDDRLDRYQMLRRLHFAVLIGALFIVIYALRFVRSGAFLSIIGVGILSAGAFLLAGFLSGFVFGIPRIAKDTSNASSSGHGATGTGAPHAGARWQGTVEPNSNLVEISDWLTKIIVGVGLVQLNRIPGEIERLTVYIANGLRDCDSSACKLSSEALALGIVIFFFSAGFLIGYLWARLYLQRAFTDLNLATQVDIGWSYADAADQAFDDGDLNRATTLIDLSLSTDPANAKAHILKGMILKRLAQKSGTPGDKALLQQALSHALEAARIKPNVGGAFYNAACYQTLLGMDHSEVLKNLAHSFELDPKLKQIAVTDEDLKDIWNDPNFKNLTTK